MLIVTLTYQCDLFYNKVVTEQAMNVILEKFPYRYIEMDNLLENGHPDYRIQKFHDWTQRYRDMYLLDNSVQLDYVIEDFEYTKWLDPDPEVAAYAKNDSEETVGNL